MTPFVPPKRKLYELLGLVGFDLLVYLLFPNLDAVILFSLGFIWNWAASNDLSHIFENRRYRFSMLKAVLRMQELALRPFKNMPLIVQKIAAVIPAGLFWTFVIFVNESEMPWWATFLGSITFELLQIELKFIKRQKETL